MPPIDVIAAMHHPLRRRILDLLTLEGPATVGQVATALDQRAGSVSHHLKTLAAAELVEPAPELSADRRESWWRAVPKSLTWSVSDYAGDPSDRVVAEVAERVNADYEHGKLDDWFAARDGLEPAWSSAAFSTQSWIRATPDELAALGKAINDLVVRWHEETPQDEQEREAVFVYARGFLGRS